MFDIGFTELLVIAVVALFVVGPERLPGAVRAGGLWFGRFKRSLREVRRELELQVGADEIRRELHNEEVMKNLEKMQRDVNNTLNQKISLDEEENFYPPGHENHDPNNDIDDEPAPANSIAAPKADADSKKAETKQEASIAQEMPKTKSKSQPAPASDEQASTAQTEATSHQNDVKP